MQVDRALWNKRAAVKGDDSSIQSWGAYPAWKSVTWIKDILMNFKKAGQFVLQPCMVMFTNDKARAMLPKFRQFIG